MGTVIWRGEKARSSCFTVILPWYPYSCKVSIPILSGTENREPSGEEWDVAIEAFKRKWPKMPLTKVINMSRGNESLNNPRQVDP